MMREVDQFINDRCELQAIHFFFINCAVNFRMLGRFKFHTILPKIFAQFLAGPNACNCNFNITMRFQTR